MPPPPPFEEMKNYVLRLVAALVIATSLPGLALADDSADHGITGPADSYVYELAEPGSYDLPRIKPAAKGHLLDQHGKQLELAALYDGRLTILSFMYTRCGDVCPLAALYLADLQSLAAKDTVLAGRLQIVSLSFDPDYDTPAVMAEYADLLRPPGIAAPRWLFLTTPDRDALAPILAAYDQPVARKDDPEDPRGPLSHLLRVFLIDGKGFIRNIYSADFLDPRLLMNDLRTLQMEAD